MWKSEEVERNIEKEASEEVTDIAVKEKEKVDSKTYKCANCGNFIKYDPVSQKLKCMHCKSLFDIHEPKPPIELAYTANSEKYFEDWGDVEKVVKCNACGATVSLNKYETTMNCPFCSAPNIVEIDAIPGLKPNAILPFKIDGEEILKYYAKWLKSKIFAPHSLRKDALQQSMSGVYIPIFTFDAHFSGTYKIRYGQHYTVTVGSGKEAHTETRTRWYTDYGDINSFFDDTQVESSKEIDQKDLNKLGGFDTKNSIEYHNQFIAGYSSERYVDGLDQSWEVAKEKMTEETRENIIAKYNADTIDYVRMQAEFYDTTYKYVLVPTWLIKYKFRKKIFGCVINGRNGKSVGKYPLSFWKVALTTLVCSGVAAALIYLIMKFLA